MNLLEFAESTISEMEKISDGQKFAKYFIKQKSICFERYQQGLVTSTSHGLDFFNNVVKYWDCPEKYYKPKNNISKKIVDYEWNFVLILQKNKDMQSYKQESFLTTSELAQELKVQVPKIMLICMEHGIQVHVHQKIDKETEEFIREELNDNR